MSRKANAVERAEDLIASAAETDRLKRDLRDAHRRYDELKSRRSDLVAAVRSAVTEAVGTIKVDRVSAPPRDRGAGTAEYAIAVWSDWQIGKRTADYGVEVARARIDRYCDRVARLTAIQRLDHPVREARVYLLGDIVEGEMIFPTQAHVIEASLYRQVVAAAPEIIVAGIRKLLAIFERVTVRTVIGNHGRLSKYHHPETNADAMAYEVARLLLRGEPRVAWAEDENAVAGERKWYVVDKISDRVSFLLVHGDQIRGGFAGYPWYGFGRRLMGWRNGAIPEPFTHSLSGHFHTPVRLTVGHLTHWGSGSTESSNTYAAEQLASQGSPSQWLLYVHPVRGVTAEHEIHLA